MQKHSKILTGFTFFDQKWGGAYPGGNYLIFGSKKSGKTILALNVIEHLVQSNFSTLFLTSDRKKSLEIQASSIYFDIEDAVSKGVLKIEFINEVSTSSENLKEIIKSTNPSILVIDEIINPSLNVLNDNYIEFIEILEESNITSFFIASLPSNDNSKQFIKNVSRNSTGIILLQKTSKNRNYSGTVSLKPNIGHFEGEFETTFKVEPIKGFITLADNEDSIYNMLSGIDNSDLLGRSQNFEYSNIYNVEEFRFLLDSKLSLSSRTGENISLISYELTNNSIEPVEICKAANLKLDEGDKICFTDKMVYILPETSDSLSVQKLAGKLDLEILKLFKNNDQMENTLIKNIQLLKPNFKIV